MARDTYLKFAGSVAGNAQIELAVPSATNSVLPRVEICRFKSVRTAGAGVTKQRPRVFSVTGAAAELISQEYRGTQVTAAADLFDTADIQAICEVDANLKLYANLDGDAGDTYSYVIWIKLLS
jgi:hypothetical protein